MNNILNIDLVNGYNSVTSSQSDTNKIELNIHISSSLADVYLEIKKQDGSVEAITDLSIDGNVIAYKLPFEKYKNSGNIEIKVKADSYESESIVLNVLEDSTENDSIIVKIENDGFIVKRTGVKKTTYSTEEQKTGETWIDGRPIYKKVYIGTIENEDKEILESDVDIDFVDDRGQVINQIGTKYPLGHFTEGYGAGIRIENNNLVLYHTEDIVGDYHVILEYIKNTD